MTRAADRVTQAEAKLKSIAAKEGASVSDGRIAAENALASARRRLSRVGRAQQAIEDASEAIHLAAASGTALSSAEPAALLASLAAELLRADLA